MNDFVVAEIVIKLWLFGFCSGSFDEKLHNRGVLQGTDVTAVLNITELLLAIFRFVQLREPLKANNTDIFLKAIKKKR